MSSVRHRLQLISILLVFVALAALGQTPARPLSALDAGFRERAMAHVRELAGFGDRVTGGPGETKAVAYVKQQMEKAGLAVSVEPFSYQPFELQQATLAAGGSEARITMLAFDPYAGAGTRTAELVFVSAETLNSPNSSGLQLEGKILATTEGANPYRLILLNKPGAIVYLSKEDFGRLQASAGKTGQISFTGKTPQRNSVNVVGVLRPSGSVKGEVILSAHLDSWKGPGANDNASGIAVLLELARQLAPRKEELPFAVKFVAFGAEELGMLGAKAYLAKHEVELQDCVLLFNMDTVGGGEGIVAQTRGAMPLPEQIHNQLPAELMDKATNDLDAKWVLNHSSQRAIFMPPSVPNWIRQAIEEAGSQLGQPIRGSAGMGSDHLVFLQAGVPATNIAAMGGTTHTAGDTPDTVRPESLEIVARIVLSVIDRARLR